MTTADANTPASDRDLVLTRLIVMRGPDGKEFPNRGVYPEVVKNERLVATDAYTRPGSRRTNRS